MCEPSISSVRMRNVVSHLRKNSIPPRIRPEFHKQVVNVICIELTNMNTLKDLIKLGEFF